LVVFSILKTQPQFSSVVTGVVRSTTFDVHVAGSASQRLGGFAFWHQLRHRLWRCLHDPGRNRRAGVSGGAGCVPRVFITPSYI
jgi:uncharacterized protein YfaQ (DUF2300 family)